MRFASWSDAADTPPVINNYIDGTLATELSTAGVTLRRVPLAATSDAVETVTAAANAGRAGTIDLIWINGKNFKARGQRRESCRSAAVACRLCRRAAAADACVSAGTGTSVRAALVLLPQNLSQANLLYGPFAAVVPNGALYDFTSGAIRTDFGYPTGGYEMPYNMVQFTMIYNTAMVGTTPPASVLELVAWIKANPGKFAYPVPTEDGAFDSAALLRHFFGAFCAPYSDFLGPFNAALYAARTPALWAALNDLHPYLWVNATTGHPPAAGDMDALFASGQIAFTFSYDPLHAFAPVAAGVWNASTTRSYVFTGGNLQGTIANTNFVAIPRNAPNLAGALVAANAIASPGQVFARAHPDVWGTFPAMAASRMDAGWTAAFGEIEAIRSAVTPDFATLAAHQLGELDPAYGQQLEADWARLVTH